MRRGRLVGPLLAMHAAALEPATRPQRFGRRAFKLPSPTFLESTSASWARVALKQVCATVLTASLALAPATAQDASTGFEEFAAKGGVMEARPSCFANECGAQSKACFGNPSCLKGVTCLGQCRGEQLCATQCFARFGSEKLNDWLQCTLEDEQCVTTGVKQDTSAFYADAPRKLEKFDPRELDGKWTKVLGYSAKYDCFPCQFNTFFDFDGSKLKNDIEFRVAKPEQAGYWQNRFVESMVAESGPQGKASLTVEGKMYGLTFHEQWYVLAHGPSQEYEVIAYKGDTQQGPYDGAFVLMRDPERYEALKKDIGAATARYGMNLDAFCRIDNACPAGDAVTQGGASSVDNAKEKLTWKDVFELTEWIRPGTLAKSQDFDVNKMK